jgi:hypothetical protein
MDLEIVGSSFEAHISALISVKDFGWRTCVFCFAVNASSCCKNLLY